MLLRPSLRPASGFTLIELLVVISIIAILAGLLFPAIALVKKSGAKTAAANTMRQIGMATACYINDSEGTLPGPLYSFVNIYYQDNRYSGGLGATLHPYLDGPVPPPGWTNVALDKLRDKYREGQGYPTQWMRWWSFRPSGKASDGTGSFDPNGNLSDGTWPRNLSNLSHHSEAIFLQDYPLDYVVGQLTSGRPLYGKYITLYWDGHIGHIPTTVNGMSQWW
jgi:prepilin-type N-terminal cleavage/methylation domain-containing protein